MCDQHPYTSLPCYKSCDCFNAVLPGVLRNNRLFYSSWLEVKHFILASFSVNRIIFFILSLNLFSLFYYRTFHPSIRVLHQLLQKCLYTILFYHSVAAVVPVFLLLLHHEYKPLILSQFDYTTGPFLHLSIDHITFSCLFFFFYLSCFTELLRCLVND